MIQITDLTKNYGKSTILENICLEEKPDVQQVVDFCIEAGLDPFIREF